MPGDPLAAIVGPGRHEELIGRICAAYGAKRYGFAVALARALFGPSARGGDVRSYTRGRLPDAFRIDVGDLRLTLWEVVVTHDLKRAKVADYWHLWGELDCEAGWRVDLLRVTSDGTQRSVDFTDVCRGAA